MISILRSDAPESKKRIEALEQRSNMDNSAQLAVVKDIIANVRERGDEALFEYTKRFDNFDVSEENIRVTSEEIAEAYESVDDSLIDSLRACIANIHEFHQRQRRNTWLDIQPGAITGQMVRPLESVGLYVPGGKAAYPSSLLMNVIPAVVAGVKRIAMVTPPDKTTGRVYPTTLVAAREAGITEIYKVGGAQAVAALAFGTKSIPRVNKITGPGNIFVALAKREVYGYVGIDMIAGPSEVLVIADKNANTKYIAADMLSQAEHDELSAAILITDSETLAKEVAELIESQLAGLEREKIARAAIETNSAIIIARDIDEAIEISNGIAPEHLELLVSDPMLRLDSIKAAGAVFMGEYSPEPLGDYFAGTNHVLPTGTSARFFSPLSVDDFVKKSSIIYYSKQALLNAVDDISAVANAEGLTAHAKSALLRREG